MISKNTIDTVFETARVEEVIGDFVQLKRAGSNLKGLSPFVNEKSPSFMVSPVKQIWKDFSSGKGGNAISFLMEHEHFTYPEAIRYLAKKYNIEIEETEQTSDEILATNEKESLFLVSEFAKTYFNDTLGSQEGKAIGLTYFRERGFTDATIEKFALGYSPDVWDAFTAFALQKGYLLDNLEKAGFTIVKENRHFDRFRGRVMFPIQSLSGRVLGFGGRILTNDKKAAKYLNSPESAIYHKSKVLYGIFQAKQAIAQQNNCYLVEGYTDVIQFHQAGIENVVASSGTALTPDQIKLVSRLTKNITVLFDGDAAGLRASLRGIDLILEEGMNVRVCTFPDGEDPDSFAKKTSYDNLVAYLQDNARDFIQFKADLLLKDAANDPVKKAEMIRDMVISISKIPDRIKREVYVQECARMMQISEQVLFSTLAQLLQKEAKETLKNTSTSTQEMKLVKDTTSAVEKVNVLYELERKIIQIILLYGHLEEDFEDTFYLLNDKGETVAATETKAYNVFQRVYLSLQEDEIEFTTTHFKQLYEAIVAAFHANGVVQLDQMLHLIPQDLAVFVSEIVLQEEKDVLHQWDKKQIEVKQKNQSVGQYVTETILTLRWFLVDSIINELKKESVTSTSAEDSQELLSSVMDYYKLIQTFSVKLGRVMSRYQG